MLFGNGISEASAVLVDGRNISHKKPTGMYTTCGINFLSTGTRTGLLPSTVCFAIIKRNICCKRKASLKHAFVPWTQNSHLSLVCMALWNPKITQLKRKIIFQTSIFWFHVNFQGCTMSLFAISFATIPQASADLVFFLVSKFRDEGR